MIGGQGRFFALVVTIEAEFFCLFFALDSMKLVMDFVMGQGGGGLLWGVEKKNQDAGTENNK